MKSLTPEQKLDIALNFLAKENQGSYLYPDSIQLKQHLLNNNIDEKEHLPIILHLKWGDYVETFYKDQKDKALGLPPNQIKITFKGIKFSHKGGYSKLLKRENLGLVFNFGNKSSQFPLF